MGSFAGIVMFIAGIVATYFALSGLILVFVGAFIGFTSTSTLLDDDNKQIMPIKKFDSIDSAKTELESLSKQLQLPWT